jgi:WD40 repeat protein
MNIICPAGPVTSLAVSPDGTYLASGHSNGMLSLWVRATGEHAATVPAHSRSVIYLNFPKTGELISADGPNGGTNWKIGANGRLTAGSTVSNALVTPLPAIPLVRMGAITFSGGDDGIIRAWNSSSGEPNSIAESPGDSVQLLSVNRDGSRFVAATNAAGIISYEGTAKQQILPGMAGSISSLHYHKEQTLHTLVVRDQVAVASELSPEGGKDRFKFQSSGGTVTAAQFTMEGARAVTGDDRGMVRIWLSSDQRLLATFDAGEQNAAKKVAIADDGKHVAAQYGTRLLLWGIGETAPTATLSSDENALFRFVPDGTRLVMSGRGGAIKVLDAITGQQEYTLYGHTAQVSALGISPDGRTLVSASVLGDVKLWDLRIGQESMSFQQHQGPVTAIEFSGNGKVLITGGKELVLWQTAKE